MQTVKKAFLTFVLCSVFMVIGAITGYFAGLGIDSIRTSSILISWRSLDNPIKFTQITDANSSTLWAKSIDGNLYKWSCHDPEGCIWAETKAMPVDADNQYDQTTTINDTCQLQKKNDQKKQPKNIIQCAIVSSRVSESSQTNYYVLLDDGTIWYGFHSVDGYAVVFITMISSFVGSLLGIIVGMIIMDRKKKRSNTLQS